MITDRYALIQELDFYAEQFARNGLRGPCTYFTPYTYTSERTNKTKATGTAPANTTTKTNWPSWTNASLAPCSSFRLSVTPPCRPISARA